jgi:hypothetical protein
MRTNTRGAKPPDSESAISGLRHAYWAGIAFIFTSGAVLLVAAWRLYLADRNRVADFKEFFPDLLLIGLAFVAGLLGASLVRSASEASVPGPVINPSEWDELGPQVVAGKEDAITQYVRLRSLTGFTGLFTKLGLTGLPLATIGLTVFFSVLFFANEAFLDLAKLTLGAFIGSFVQKQVGERQVTSQVVELPSGKSLRVRSTPPSVI